MIRKRINLAQLFFLYILVSNIITQKYYSLTSLQILIALHRNQSYLRRLPLSTEVEADGSDGNDSLDGDETS
jgi:hypothetical protein